MSEPFFIKQGHVKHPNATAQFLLRKPWLLLLVQTPSPFGNLLFSCTALWENLKLSNMLFSYSFVGITCSVAKIFIVLDYLCACLSECGSVCVHTVLAEARKNTGSLGVTGELPDRVLHPEV